MVMILEGPADFGGDDFGGEKEDLGGSLDEEEIGSEAKAPESSTPELPEAPEPQETPVSVEPPYYRTVSCARITFYV